MTQECLDKFPIMLCTLLNSMEMILFLLARNYEYYIVQLHSECGTLLTTRCHCSIWCCLLLVPSFHLPQCLHKLLVLLVA